MRRRVAVACPSRASVSGFCWLFFFQAEDGIRDTSVTGVQTCALPIWKTLRNHLSTEPTFPLKSHLLALLMTNLALCGYVMNFLCRSMTFAQLEAELTRSE